MHVFDDRWVRRRIHEPRAVPAWVKSDDAALEADVRWVCRESVRRQRSRNGVRMVAVGLILAFMLAIAAWYVRLMIRGPVDYLTLVLHAIVIAMLSIQVWWAWRHMRVGDVRQARALYLERGRCPSCAYGIGGLEAAGDGCVVCPECGAAWRMDRSRGG